MCFKIEIFGLSYFRVQVLLSMSFMDMPLYGTCIVCFVIQVRRWASGEIFYSKVVYMNFYNVLDLCLGENGPLLYLKLGV